MNHCYRLVYNACLQIWQAVAEFAKSNRKSSAITLLPALFLSATALAETAANALPTGAQVISGQSAISQSGNQLNIVQSTQKSIINWGSYNIGTNSTVNYVQPNNGAISLNRVIGQDPSQIFGHLNANGQVWLINPNGILFGQSAQVNVGGLAASTLNIADDDFLNGNYKFTGGTGSVINQGSIVAKNGGYVAMFSPEIRNEGIISALEGALVLASGDAILMSFNNDGLINVQVDNANVNTLIENKHLMRVGGGQVLMSSKAANGLITSVINNSGKIEADSMISDGGTVRLTGAKTVINSGEISATSTAAKGGSVHLLGENVGVFDNGSINLNGKTGGGEILVGGDFQGKNSNIQNAKKTFISQNAKLSADATEAGDGGKVIVWADDITRYYGSISAKGGAVAGNGGFVEVSGKNYLDFIGQVDTTAQHGNFGVLLLDPTNITISTGVNSIESSGATIFQETTPTATSILNTTTLQTALASNNVEVTTASAAASAGTITVANAVTWTSGNSLTLTANSTIAINAAITTGTAASSLILNATGNVTQSAAGIIGGAGGLVKNGAGTATLTLANTYTGATTINTGTLAGAVGTTSAVTVNLGATYSLNNANRTIGSLAGAGNVIPGTGTRTLTTGGNNASTTFSGVLGNGAGTLNLTKTGTGVMTLSGANTYTGATTISAGTLRLAGGAAIADTSAVTLANTSGATLDLNGTNETIGSLAGGGATGGNVTLGAGTLTAGSNNTSTTYAGVISGTGGVAKLGTGTFTLSGNNTYTGTTTVSAGSLRIGNGGTTGSVAGNIVNNANVTFNRANNLTYAGAISGTGTTTKLGAGTLTLTGDNTYTGNTTVTTGSLSIGNGGTTGSVAGNIFNNANVTFNRSNALTYAGVISGTGATTKLGAGTLTLTGTNTYTGGTTVTAGSLQIGGGGTTGSVAGNIVNNANVTFNRSNALTYAGVISGTGTTTKLNAGTLTLTGANTYTGATTVTAGTLVAANNAALGGGAGATTVANGATLALQGGITTAENITLNGLGVGAGGALRNLSGNNTVTGTITQASASRINSDAGLLTLSGAGNVTGAFGLTVGGAGNTTISKVIATGAGTLTKDDAGTLTLSGANTYTGATTVTAGTLVAANNAALGGGAGATTVANGATLALQGGITTAEALTLTGTGVSAGGALRNLSGNNTATGAITLGTGGARINSDAGLLTISGAGNITGAAQPLTVGGAGNTTISKIIGTTAGTLTKDGAGVLTLSGANTYTGATNINAGTLSATNANALGAAGGGTTVASDATLNVNNVTLAESALTINGTGVGGAGALTGTGAANVSGTVATASDSSIGTTSAASTLTLTGVVTAANNLNIVGAGNVVATNAGNNFSTVNINGANNVSLRDANGIILGNGASNLTGNFSLQTQGAVTQTAGITVGGATTINAGAGDVILNNTANDFNALTITSGKVLNIVDANAMTLSVLGTVQTITARTLSNNLTLAGSFAAAGTGSGTAVNLVSAQNFLNPGNSLISVGVGSRWLVYSTSPLLDTRGAGLIAASDFKQYNTAFGDAIFGTGDGFIYSLAPTITPTLTGSATKTYNGTVAAPIGSLTLGQSGAIDGDTITLTGLTSATYDTANAGTGKTVSASGISFVGTGANNAGKPVYGYTLASTTATGAVGTINQANLTVTASSNSKTYGQTVNFAGTEFTSVGLVTGETIGSTTLASLGAVNTANVAGSPYAITVSGATGGTFSASNYNITYANGSLVVNPAALIVTANNASRPQGAPNPAFSSTITGFVNGETSAVINGTLNHSSPATATSLPGNYAITPFGVTADNYTITFVDGILTVGQPTSITAFNGALTRPEQAQQTCDRVSTDNAMISGLDDYGVDDIEYKESASQPQVAGVVANALSHSTCLKL